MTTESKSPVTSAEQPAIALDYRRPPANPTRVAWWVRCSAFVYSMGVFALALGECLFLLEPAASATRNWLHWSNLFYVIAPVATSALLSLAGIVAMWTGRTRTLIIALLLWSTWRATYHILDLYRIAEGWDRMGSGVALIAIGRSVQMLLPPLFFALLLIWFERDHLQQERQPQR